MGREDHKHRHRHHHHKHRSENSVKDAITVINEETQPVDKKINDSVQNEDVNDTILKVKRILIDFRKQDENALDDLKTQFNLLDNGYSVDLTKISNSLLQGTLHVVFSLLHLPETNHGYFWNEEDYDGMQISSLFNDCLNVDIHSLEQSLDNSNQQENKENNDNNEIDIDDLDSESEEELNYGPSLPETSFTKGVVENGKHLVGPTIPDEILQMISEGIPVQIENEEEEVGPSLPEMETRKPTAEALEKVEEIREEQRRKENDEEKPKKLEREEWMTMLPNSAMSSIFASAKPRRFANVPAGCKMDPSWAETPEQREKRIREHLSKTLIGGYKEELQLTKEQEKQKEKEMAAYFEEYEKEHRFETLSEIHQRLKKQKKENKESDDKYSRDAIFKNSGRRRNNQDVDFVQNKGSLKSRFGTVTYKAGSIFIVCCDTPCHTIFVK